MLSWLKERMIPKYKPNEKEKLILDVVSNLCQHSDGVTITNHKFTFSNTSPQMFQDMIVELVVTAIEKSRDEFETAVFQNEVELLENIVANIKHTK